MKFKKSYAASRILQLYLLDCCHAGEILRKTRGGISETFGVHLASQPCVFVITAVTGDEKAIEENGHGIFTKLICRGVGKQKQAMEGDKLYTTGTNLFKFVEERAFEKSDGNMTPQSSKMFLEVC